MKTQTAIFFVAILLASRCIADPFDDILHELSELPWGEEWSNLLIEISESDDRFLVQTFCISLWIGRVQMAEMMLDQAKQRDGGKLPEQVVRLELTVQERHELLQRMVALYMTDHPLDPYFRRVLPDGNGVRERNSNIAMRAGMILPYLMRQSENEPLKRAYVLYRLYAEAEAINKAREFAEQAGIAVTPEYHASQNQRLEEIEQTRIKILKENDNNLDE